MVNGKGNELRVSCREGVGGEEGARGPLSPPTVRHSKW
jgi:hypothetical protein